MEFTPEQQQVIDLRDKNILVSAAAGSGKTATLVERIVQMVCDEAHPVDIDHLLVVTFTKAAAAEMRERVHKRIAEELEAHPASHHIQKQYTLVHRAQITTIDSFCLNILRNHFQEIGLEPDFRPMDEGEKKLLLMDVLGAVLEEQYALAAGGTAPEGAEPVPGFVTCVEHFCTGGDDGALEEAVMRLYEYAESFPWPEDLLEQRKGDYSGSAKDPYAGPVGDFLRKYFRGLLSGYVEAYRRMAEICEEPDGPYMYGELADAERAQLERVAAKQTIPEIGLGLDAFLANLARLPGKKDDSVNPGKKEAAKKLRDHVKEALYGLQDDFFRVPQEVAAERCERTAETAEALLELTIRFRRRLQEEKRSRRLVDFSDMEHYALEILLTRTEEGFAPSAVALEYREYFHEIMIDEYQDSNLVQEQILQAISGEDEGRYNRFMVGDVKQSIYSFRQARPDLFLEKYDTYLPEGEKRRIDLARNFRSRREVIDSVNAVFERIMRAELCGIEYDERAALYAGADFPPFDGNATELLLFSKSLKEDFADSGKADEVEARIIAGRIRELLGTQMVAAGRAPEDGLRPMEYRDIVVLHRSAGTVADLYRRVFEEEGIPIYCAQQTGYFAAGEVQDLLNLLRVLNNPRQDIPFYGVMKSYFGGFTESEAAELRAGRKAMSLCETLQQQRSESARVDSFLKMLEEYRFRATYLTIRELLQQILDETDYLDYVTALPAGLKRRANVEMLLVRASDFEKTSYLGLFHFIRYIDQLEKYEADPGAAEVLDEHANLVRLMTIHKSKGLEFPVVFLAGCGHGFNFRDVHRNLMCDEELGLGLDFVDTETRQRSKTLRSLAVSRKKVSDLLSEELRVLYVAMTRPKEKLIMVGACKDAEKAVEEAKDHPRPVLSYQQFMESKSQLDFLLPILGNTGIETRVYDENGIRLSDAREQVRSAERLTRLQHSNVYGDAGKLHALEEAFSWQYAFANLQKVYAKTTVSELKMAAMAETDEGAYDSMEKREHEAYVPAFARGPEEEHISGTTRGNAYHRTMEIMDFDQTLGASGSDGELRENLLRFLEEETASRHLKSEYREALNLSKIMAFLRSDIARRMHAAARQDKLFREQPFVFGISATRLGPDYPDEQVLIQGIIDAFFEEDDGLVLLDYKTDRIDSMADLHARYDAQLDYYQEAIERLTGKKVKEKLLYSFHLGECG